MEECGRWLPWIDWVYTPCSDSESGDLRFLPWPGSLMEQPYSSMTVVWIIQGEYKRAKAEAKAKVMQRQ